MSEHEVSEPTDHVDVVALALGDGDATSLARAAAHVGTCSWCRAEYDGVRSAMGEILPAVPPVQPPIGFEASVLGALGAAPARRRARSRGWLAAAAIALLVTAGGVMAWRTSADGPGADVRALTVVGDGQRSGAEVGTVSLGRVDDRTVMVVAIVAPPAGVSYRCRTTLRDGSTLESDAWAPGSGAWIVRLPDGAERAVASVELIGASSGEVWSAATFD